MSSLPNFFPKKDAAKSNEHKDSLEDPSESIASDTVQEPVAPIVIKKPLEVVTVSFYGKKIRKIFFQERWYFVLDDVLAVAQSAEEKADPALIKNERQYIEESESYIIRLPVLVDGILMKVECIDSDGFDWMHPIIQGLKFTFPGPFPGWIHA